MQFITEQLNSGAKSCSQVCFPTFNVNSHIDNYVGLLHFKGEIGNVKLQ